jgi:hypothetical protein
MVASETLQFLVKKLREQRSWKVKKYILAGSLEFNNCLKKILRNEGER